ncbi:MAG: ABC transporter ATP-binding protein [Thermomicrobiales bacterium]|nr:ABC transporter ATP-binding protein [Thermomicrobiales bacterium]
MSGPKVTVTGLAVALGGREVVRGADFILEAGTLTVMVGPNGAGKTTILRALAGLAPSRGSIDLDGAPIGRLARRERARRIGYLPQGHVFHWPLPVADVVALGRMPHGAGAGDLGEADRAAVADALRICELEALADRPVTTLSGGERSRVALARVLAVQAEIVLADEPIASLDPRHQLTVLGLLRDLAARGGTVLAVMHDLGLAARYADRVIVLDEGKVVAAGEPEAALEPGLLRQVFGVEAHTFREGERTVVVPWATA